MDTMTTNGTDARDAIPLVVTNTDHSGSYDFSQFAEQTKIPWMYQMEKSRAVHAHRRLVDPSDTTLRTPQWEALGCRVGQVYWILRAKKIRVGHGRLLVKDGEQIETARLHSPR